MTAEEVIDAMYAAVFAGDVEGALAYCSDDAVWHGVTPAPVTGDVAMRRYLGELLPDAIGTMAGYTVTSMERDTIDELVVVRLRSTHGSGVMVFRVADELIRDICVINSQGRDTPGYFRHLEPDPSV
jgi:ketosteroid isomerase-like protein